MEAKLTKEVTNSMVKLDVQLAYRQLFQSKSFNIQKKTGDEGTRQLQSLTLSDPWEIKVQAMLGHITDSGVAVKSQQRGDDELSASEKSKILRDFFDQKPVLFLERYNKVIRVEDLQCFSHLSNIYEVNFYLNEIKKRTDAKVSDVTRKNRRYEALKKLEADGDYFSDGQMRSRDPLMFEHYVGQYMTDEEKINMKKEIDKTDLKFSTILCEFMDETDVKLLKERQQDEEDMVEEEEDSDTEEEESEMEDDSEKDDDIPIKPGDSSNPKQRKVKTIPEEERELLRQEFRHYMQEQFLKGKDEDFDYTTVDDNVEYDSIDIRGRDEEEKYFDDEEPCAALTLTDSGSDSSLNMKTGDVIQDRDGVGVVER